VLAGKNLRLIKDEAGYDYRDGKWQDQEIA